MTPRHRHSLIACLAGATLALGAAFALSGWRLLETIHRTLEIYYGDRGDPVAAPHLGVLLLVLAAAALLAGAVALAFAGRRAARALERASLIELAQ